MGIKYGRGWGGARISLSQGSVLSREYVPSRLLFDLIMTRIVNECPVSKLHDGSLQRLHSADNIAVNCMEGTAMKALVK